MYQKEQIQMIAKKMYNIFDAPISLVVEKTKISRPTVSKFFKLKEIKPSKVEIIYDTCLALLEEKDSKRRTNIEKQRTLDRPITFKKAN